MKVMIDSNAEGEETTVQVMASIPIILRYLPWALLHLLLFLFIVKFHPIFIGGGNIWIMGRGIITLAGLSILILLFAVFMSRLVDATQQRFFETLRTSWVQIAITEFPASQHCLSGFSAGLALFLPLLLFGYLMFATNYLLGYIFVVFVIVEYAPHLSLSGFIKDPYHRLKSWVMELTTTTAREVICLCFILTVLIFLHNFLAELSIHTERNDGILFRSAVVRICTENIKVKQLKPYESRTNYEEQNLKNISALSHYYPKLIRETFFLLLLMFLLILSFVLLLFAKTLRESLSLCHYLRDFPQIEAYLRYDRISASSKTAFGIIVLLVFLLLVPCNFIAGWFTVEILYYAFTGHFISNSNIVEVFSWVPTSLLVMGLPIFWGKFFLIAVFLKPVFRLASLIIWAGTKLTHLLKPPNGNTAIPKEIRETVRSLCEEAEVKMPKLILVPGWDINILVEPGALLRFIPKLIIGQGALKILSKEEISAVVAHEIAHLKYEIKWITLCHYVSYATLTSPSLLTIMFDLRRRELRADNFAARLLGKPEPLISALRKIRSFQSSDMFKETQVSQNGLKRNLSSKIRERFFEKGKGIVALYDFTYGRGLLGYVHPPFGERIQALEEFSVSSSLI